MIKLVPAGELLPGMYVSDTGLSWVEKPYLYSKPGPLTEEAIKALRAKGFTSAFIDTEKGPLAQLPAQSSVVLDRAMAKDIATEKKLIAEAIRVGKPSPDAPPGPAATATPGAPPSPAAPAAPGATAASAEPLPPGRTTPLREEMRVAKAVYDDSLNFARSFVQDVRLGRQVEYEKAQPLVEGIIDSVMRNEDALIGMKQLRASDEYTFTHSINVTVLSTIFGKYMGLSRKDLDELGRAALFHDVGKAKIPNSILNKPDRLTDAEFTVIKSHPIRGFELIHALHKASNEILKGILEHHEKHDGHGYPGGLAGGTVSRFARIISVADVYDALTSERVYKKGMLANQALKIIFGLREKDFAPHMVDQFIKCLGIYPVGSLVKLSSGLSAVVTGANQIHPLEPVVKIVLDHLMRPIPPHSIDLSSAPGRGEGKLKIVEVLDHKELGIDLTQYLVA